MITDKTTHSEIRTLLAKNQADFEQTKKWIERSIIEMQKPLASFEAQLKKERDKVKRGLLALNCIALTQGIYSLRSEMENAGQIINLGMMTIENSLSLDELASKIPDTEKMRAEVMQDVSKAIDELKTLGEKIRRDQEAREKSRQEQVKSVPKGMYGD